MRAASIFSIFHVSIRRMFFSSLFIHLNIHSIAHLLNYSSAPIFRFLSCFLTFSSFIICLSVRVSSNLFNLSKKKLFLILSLSSILFFDIVSVLISFLNYFIIYSYSAYIHVFIFLSTFEHSLKCSFSPLYHSNAFSQYKSTTKMTLYISIGLFYCLHFPFFIQFLSLPAYLTILIYHSFTYDFFLSFCLSACLSACLSVCFPLSLSLSLHYAFLLHLHSSII
ncbi:unnamed protein product [Acanthosepion pharaonis]|uniref:Uncharacterized protein n=1 Tax=Acanthosepion pharaonis TaxID=158019 RepID=A0A812D9I6_ACAPH|nr:unnamed protein product [Sepia pharaonis]